MNWGFYVIPSRMRAPVTQSQLAALEPSGYAYYDALVANYFKVG